MSVWSSWFPVEAELLGARSGGELPPSNFWIHPLISIKLDSGEVYLSSHKFYANEVTK